MAEAGIKTPISGEQGFVLSDGSFVIRTHAKKVAVTAGQIKKGMGKFDKLYSEDVW